jgi:hypothetical protein
MSSKTAGEKPVDKRAAAGCGEPPTSDTLKAGEFNPDTVKRGTVKRSKMGRRRAIVLVIVHVLIFAHILHWKLKGKTLSP